MWHRMKWSMNQVRKKLWFRPLTYAVFAVAAVVSAAAADRWIDLTVPRVDREMLESLLTIFATSMLSVATLAVASMVAAYASASSTATPRAFSLVIADDVSQTALSGFIGAFIFSVVAFTAVKTGSYGDVGLFVTFAFTIGIFAVVIMIFLRWVDRIARLGRLGTTIDRVEFAAADAIEQRRQLPLLGGVRDDGSAADGVKVFASKVGYVQTINMGAIQRIASRLDGRIAVRALPGTFVAPGKALATVATEQEVDDATARDIGNAFIIGDDRTFEEDPRFGLVALSEIAARALSPAVNDPGTAIDIVGTFVRIFSRWGAPPEEFEPSCDRVLVPALSTMDMFDDAFTAIARDGAGLVEVMIRLQKAFIALTSVDEDDVRAAAIHHSRLALARAEQALKLPEERERIRLLAERVALGMNA